MCIRISTVYHAKIRFYFEVGILLNLLSHTAFWHKNVYILRTSNKLIFSFQVKHGIILSD